MDKQVVTVLFYSVFNTQVSGRASRQICVTMTFVKVFGHTMCLAGTYGTAKGSMEIHTAIKK